MNLILDLGNTSLYMGLYKEGKLIRDYRYPSYSESTANQLADALKCLVKSEADDVKKAILSSVKPSLNEKIRQAVKMVCQINLLILEPGVKSGLKIKIDNPSSLGADLLSDAVGGKLLYKDSFVVIDFGTATKVLVVDKEGSFIGGAIAPGVKIGADALTSNTALLSEFEIKKPTKVIGKNDKDALNSGSVNGNIAMVLGLISMMEKELGYPLHRILTGGYAYIFADYLPDFTYVHLLTLNGLNDILERN